MLINIEQHTSDFNALMDHRVRRAKRRLSVIQVTVRLFPKPDPMKNADLGEAFHRAAQAAHRLSDELQAVNIAS